MGRSVLQVVDDGEYHWRLQWFFPDDDDIGAILGDELYTEEQLNKNKSEDREHILATITASRTVGVEHDRNGFAWQSKKDATNALRAIKAAMKSDQPPWPEWAVKAKAEGWTPPKNWKPT